MITLVRFVRLLSGTNIGMREQPLHIAHLRNRRTILLDDSCKSVVFTPLVNEIVIDYVGAIRKDTVGYRYRYLTVALHIASPILVEEGGDEF